MSENSSITLPKKQLFLRERYFYILVALFIVCTLFYYFGELVTIFGWSSLRWEIFYTVHDLHRLLFLMPILYASYYYRLRGAVLSNIAALLIFLPRAFLISPYPDATLRMLVFVVVSMVVSVMLTRILSDREKLNAIIGKLKQSEESSRDILDNLLDSFIDVDLAGKIIYVNKSAGANLGYQKEELVGRSFRIFTADEKTAGDVLEAYNEVFRTGQANKGFIFNVRRKDGTTRAVNASISLIRDAEGRPAGFRSIGRDVTEQQLLEREIRRQHAFLRQIIDTSPNLVWVKDNNHRYIIVNRTLADAYGTTSQSMEGKTDIELGAQPHEAAQYNSDDDLIFQSKEKMDIPEESFTWPSGEVHYYHTVKLPMINEEGIYNRVLGISNDITRLKQIETTLRENEAALVTVFNSVGAGIMLVDCQTQVITDINNTALSMVGRTKENVVGHVCHSFICPAEKGRCPVKDLGQTVDSSERKLLCADGQQKNILKNVSTLTLHGRQYYLESFIDITERKLMEQKLEEMATHDNLTGLPNRVLLADRFIMAAAMAKRNNSGLAVMSLDLDKFKAVNDTLGHDAGDQVLKVISARLTGVVRACDTLARVGGDEFVLLMVENTDSKDVSEIAKRILDSFREPLYINDNKVDISTSIGIALYPDDGDSLIELLKKSDAAMYYSKGHGRNQFKLWGDGDVRLVGDHKSSN